MAVLSSAQPQLKAATQPRHPARNWLVSGQCLLARWRSADSVSPVQSVAVR